MSLSPAHPSTPAGFCMWNWCVAVCCSVLQCAAVCCVCCNSVPSTFPIPDRRGRMYVCLYVWMYSYGQIIFWHLHFWKQAETLVSKLQRMKHSKLSCFCWHICCFRRNICCFGRFLNWFRLFLPAFKIGGVWRFVAVWCSVVQRVAVCCSVSKLERSKVICPQLYIVCVIAACCSVLQCATVWCCSVLQCVAVCCSVLQCVVTQYLAHPSTSAGVNVYMYVNCGWNCSVL